MRFRPTVFVAALLLPLAASAPSHAIRQGNRLGDVVARQHAALSHVDSVSGVPMWLAWRVFHESLRHYEERSGSEKVGRVLGRQFGLTGTDIDALRSVGTSYLATLGALDAEATRDVQARYGASDLPERNGERPVRLPAGMSLLATAKRDGLHQSFEARSNAVLIDHVSALRRQLDTRSFDAVLQWVETGVRSRIEMMDHYTPGPPVPIATGAPIFTKSERR
jgi:hypothetical protein